MRDFCGRTRREFIWETGCGFTGVALTALFGNDLLAAEGGKFVNPLAPKQPHLPAKAKSVIFLYMYGGPSHIDTFDYKPAHFEGTLFRRQGAPILDLARPDTVSETSQRRLLDALREYNDEHDQQLGKQQALASRIASYELAFKMQASAPEATDLSQE